MVYIVFYFLFIVNIYLMISVCTKVELKFEKEVENKLEKDNELKLLNKDEWKRTIFFLKSEKINNILENIVEFFEPVDDNDKERIFLSKH